MRAGEKLRNAVKILLLCCLLFGSLWVVPPAADAGSSRYFVELSGKDAAASLKGYKVISSFSLDGHEYAVLTGQKTLKELQSHPGIVSAAVDRKAETSAFTQKTSWGVKQSKAYRLTAKDCACKIAIIDSGISDHADLKGRVLAKTTYLFGKETPKSASDSGDDQHGTHVAGIIAANHNTFGTAGMLPDARLMIVKVFDGKYGGYFSDIAAGIAWAVKNGAEVINISLGVEGGKDEASERILKSAYDKGVVIVSSTGNEGTVLNYPASSTFTLAVGAIDKYNRMPEWSNYGRGLDLLAPGVDISSTVFTDKYASFSGTSMATPHVTASVSKLLPLYKGPRNGERVEWVRKRLTEYADQRSVSVKGRTVQVPVLNVYKSYYGLK